MEIEYKRATGAKRFLICAIHAATEPGTAAFATALAAADPKNRGLYIFHGPRVTSTEFSERIFDRVVKSYDFVVSIHGMLSTSVPVYVGGRNTRLVSTLRSIFHRGRQTPRRLAGRCPENIVNHGRYGGLQLELSPTVADTQSPLRTWVIHCVDKVLAHPSYTPAA
jgi:phage replication-related protein YjqB (UPF0714/DUF867 family)